MVTDSMRNVGEDVEGLVCPLCAMDLWKGSLVSTIMPHRKPTALHHPELKPQSYPYSCPAEEGMCTTDASVSTVDHGRGKGMHDVAPHPRLCGCRMTEPQPCPVLGMVAEGVCTVDMSVSIKIRGRGEG